MKGRIVASAVLSCAVVFVLIGIWWGTGSSHVTSHVTSALSCLSLPRPAKTTTSPSNLTGAYPIVDKVAVIVETRPIISLIPLIQHFASVLGSEWPILFFTHASTVRALEAFGQGSRSFERMVNNGQVKIIELPSDAPLYNYLGISHFLASEWFWKQMDPAKHMLLFQTDSIICANSGHQMEDFFEYDFVGAAHPYFRDAFNGGLSLRNVTLSQEIVRQWNIADDIVNGTGLGRYEDVWFWDKMKDLGGRFPTRAKASEFAVDYTWAERPLGYHGINKGEQVDRADEIYKWCPEAAIAAASGAVLELNEAEQINNKTVEDVETAGGKHLSFKNTRS